MLDSGTVMGHFQHCSVMRLSCLDELVNNDIIIISVIRVICLAKKVQYFGGTFGLYRLMFLFLSFFSRNDNISFGWNFVREGLKRSHGWIRQIADEYSFVGKSWRISYTGWILLISSPFLLVLLLKRKNKNHLWIL